MFPVILSTPWFNVYSYGVMLALGYSIGTLWIVFQCKREEISAEAIFDMLLMQMVVGVLGSRFLFLAEAGTLFDGIGNFLNFAGGGLTFYGAFLSCLVFDLLFLRFKGIPFWKAMDCVAQGMILCGAIARIGCFLNGCCHGIPSNYPWGVVFPKIGAIPVHPTQLYESMGAFVIFLLLFKVGKWRRNYGQVCLAMLMSYSIFRFNVEFWRGDNPVHALGMTLSQWVSIGILIFGAIVWKVIDATPSLRVHPQVSNIADPVE